MERFIVALRQHSVFGFIFVPYLIVNDAKKSFFNVSQLANKEYMEKNKGKFTSQQQQLIQIIDEFHEKNLMKFFTKKAKDLSEFYATITEELIDKQIRPYIEKRLAKCYKHIAENNISVFFKADYIDRFHETDELKVFKTPAETIFNFVKEKTGSKYYLTVYHSGKEMKIYENPGNIVSIEPCILHLNDNLFIFSDIDGKKLKPFFIKNAIDIPVSAEKKYYETFILNVIEKYRVNALGFKILNDESIPNCVLSLEKDWKNEPILIPTFFYGKRKFLPNSTQQIVVTLKQDDNEFQFTKLTRNSDWEKSVIQFLTNKKLIPEIGTNFKLKYDSTQSYDYKLGELIDWIKENSHAFSEYRISVNQQFFKEKFYIGSVTLNIRVKNKIDWFDLYMTVSFGEFSIPFIKLKDNILNNKPQYRLPNGEIAILPEEWFEKYRQILITGQEIMGNVRLSLHHFALLENFDENLVEGTSQKYLNHLKNMQSAHENSTFTIPSEIKAELRPYQKIGVEWLNMLRINKFGGCLADDMGLGKTLQTICLLQIAINEFDREAQLPLKRMKQLDIFGENEVVIPNIPASLIIVPVSLLFNWKNELRKFAPNIKVGIYHGNDRAKIKNRFEKYHVILSSYGIVRQDVGELAKYEFLYTILDESQNIKNQGSKIYMAVKQLTSHYKLLLTGTPVENSLSDLWAQMNFANEGLLGNYPFFRSEYQLPIEKQQDEHKMSLLKTLIQPFILRRSKEEVAKDLPPLTEQLIYCEMEEEQRILYEKEKSKVRNTLMQLLDENDNKRSNMFILQGLTLLRQISNHPKMLNPDYQGLSGKFEEVIELVNNVIQEKHKILIFSSFVRHLNLFASYFDSSSINYLLLTGETTNREKIINEFQNNEEIPVFLISIKAGGVGLNLTNADYVFILDPWWNPAIENQAIARSHRIGQHNNVFVYRFISIGSIEEKIQIMKERKSNLANTFINTNNPFSELPKDIIAELFE